MARIDNSSFNFGESVDESFNSDDLNSPDNNIDLDQLQRVHEQQDMDARHKIVKNIYDLLQFLTKKYIILPIVIILVFIYPFSQLDLPNSLCSHSKLIKEYLQHLFSIFVACASFIFGAIVSNWVTIKISKK